MSAQPLDAILGAAFPQLFANVAVPKSPFDDEQHAPLTPLSESDAATLASARLELERNRRRQNEATPTPIWPAHKGGEL